MGIAFYAPMKPPTSPRPSGDRLMARLLMSALKHAGHDVSLVSKFRSWNENGGLKHQDLLENHAKMSLNEYPNIIYRVLGCLNPTYGSLITYITRRPTL